LESKLFWKGNMVISLGVFHFFYALKDNLYSKSKAEMYLYTSN
jgi:hypothetical protein